MITIIIVLCTIILVGIVGIYYVKIYNRLLNVKIKIEEADTLINIHLKKRYDYVIRTTHLVKKKLNLDIDIFKTIENMKTKKVSNIELDKKINEAYLVILRLKDDYPELNNNRGFKDILSDFRESNEIIETAKSFYDKYANNLNYLLSSFPSNLIGKIHKIKKRDYYKTNSSNEEKIID